MNIFKIYYFIFIIPSYIIISINIMLYCKKISKLITNKIINYHLPFNTSSFLYLIILTLLSPLCVFFFIIDEGIYAKIVFCNNLIKVNNISFEDKKKLMLWIDGKI